MLKTIRTLTLTAVLAALTLGMAAANVANAQQPAAQAVTVWEGRETLQGFGSLKFEFSPNGQVLMCDARSNPQNRATWVRGTFTQNGMDVTVTFKDCVYQGRINGQNMTGTARFNNNPNNPWTFDLRFVQN